MLFKNILLAVDVDGTLFNDDSVVPEKNIKAINEFRENGGLFTIATGRATSYSRRIALGLDIDIPTVVYNGGMVYDFNNDKLLWQRVLPFGAREYVTYFLEKFPTLGIDVMIGENIYSITSNKQSKIHEANIGVPVIRCSLDDVPDVEHHKILLMDEIDVIDSLYDYSLSLELDDVSVTRSSPYFFEVLPDNTNKGEGLKALVDLCGFNEHYVVAAGDFINDIEMLEMADLGIAVENALDEVKAVADLIVCDNNSGAIYEIVELLKSMKK